MNSTHTLPTAKDAAAYLFQQHKPGDMNFWDFQKIMYYTQAWSLAWDDKPMFSDPIYAWGNGPCILAFCNTSKPRYRIRTSDGDPDALDIERRETVDAVWDYYGPHTSQWLKDLVTSEDPWKQARQGMPCTERGNAVIAHEDMQAYYQGLLLPVA